MKKDDYMNKRQITTIQKLGLKDHFHVAKQQLLDALIWSEQIKYNARMTLRIETMVKNLQALITEVDQ